MDTMLKKKEILRDEDGRFLPHGEGLIKKTSKNKLKNKIMDNPLPVEGKRGPGRPPGSPNRITANLKQMILESLDEVGGKRYLRRLAIENSSAYCGLLGKILPAVLAADTDSNGGPAVIEFRRVIVMPDGTRHIEGETPKQLEHKPAPHVLPTLQEVYEERMKNKDLDE